MNSKCHRVNHLNFFIHSQMANVNQAEPLVAAT
jgi:hypothetical protein